MKIFDTVRGIVQANRDTRAATEDAQARAPSSGAPGVADSSFRPSWYNEEEHGPWTQSSTNAYNAWMNTIGRDPGNMGAINQWAGLGSYENIARSMSLTPEARRSGSDPSAFGNEVTDPSTLSDEERGYYDVWEAHNKGKPFYSGDKQFLDWQRAIGTPEVFQAEMDGTLKRGPNGEYIVTQAAIDKYGEDKLQFGDSGAGHVIITPVGSKIDIKYTGDLWKDSGDYTSYWADQGYQVSVTAQAPTSGVTDFLDGALEAVGLGRDLRNVILAPVDPVPLLQETFHVDQAAFLTDPLNITSGLKGGSERYRENIEGGSSLTGLGEEDMALTQGVGQAVVNTALTAFVPGGAAMAFLLSSMSTASRANAGLMSWEDASIGIGVSAASSAFMVGGTGWSAALPNALNSSLSTTLTTGLTGDRNWDDAFLAGAVAGAGSLVGSGINMAVGTNNQLLGALYGAAGGAVVSGGSSAAMGASGRDLLISSVVGASTGAVAGAGQARDRSNGNLPESAIGDRLFSWGKPTGTRIGQWVGAQKQTRSELVSNRDAAMAELFASEVFPVDKTGPRLTLAPSRSSLALESRASPNRLLGSLDTSPAGRAPFENPLNVSRPPNLASYLFAQAARGFGESLGASLGYVSPIGWLKKPALRGVAAAGRGVRSAGQRLFGSSASAGTK